jgi:hypothetical protein
VLAFGIGTEDQSSQRCVQGMTMAPATAVRAGANGANKNNGTWQGRIQDGVLEVQHAAAPSKAAGKDRHGVLMWATVRPC